MLESIRGIEKALAGKTIRDYGRSWLLRSAVERGIEIISEASRHLGNDLKAQHKDVRWKDIAGIGNILRHDYQRVDAAIIWKAVKDDLPPLKAALLELREAFK
ncbi:HepT-like ribonuclease domain-containing protein [Bradyrhizobium sp. Leo170]|uniref:HepT-like ribonuclease domain-containing protein n=1 Tax=Bradyrhizobium sp. Leo170 TaxID=1571199 RepID=UPI0013EEC3D7|nr:HepT-like ribonuclease domain-containing protein [Bradyrhizobium sp. Leo170]